MDKGYRGHGYTGPAEVHVAGQGGKGLSRAERKRHRRRSAIEPKIGHLQSDHRMDRCFLAGLDGDAINAVLAAAGSNLRKRRRRLYFAPLAATENVATAPALGVETSIEPFNRLPTHRRLPRLAA